MHQANPRDAFENGRPVRLTKPGCLWRIAVGAVVGACLGQASAAQSQPAQGIAANMLADPALSGAAILAALGE